MQWNLFSNTWRSLKSENALFRSLVPVLVICNLISSIGWLTKDRITVLVPPNLTDATSVAKRSADAGYKKAWALYVSSLLGNVTPGNAAFVLESLQLLMAPRPFATLRGSVASDVEMIRKDGVSVSFEQKTVLYERETDKVFVIGRTGIANSAGGVTKFDRVFEMRVTIENGQPQVVDIQTYQGKPKTLDVLKAEASAPAPKEDQQ